MKFKLTVIALVFCVSTSVAYAFSFDTWQSGMTLDEVLTISEQKDLPIRKWGVFSKSQHFDPKTSRAHADEGGMFYYNATLLDQHAEVRLNFTESTKLLYEAKILWHGVSTKKDFQAAVEKMLKEKYGVPNESKQSFSKSKTWVLDDRARLVLTYYMSFLELSYMDQTVEKGGPAGKKDNRTKQTVQGAVPDYDKF